MRRQALNRAQVVVETTGDVDVAKALVVHYGEDSDTGGGGYRLLAEYGMYLDLAGVETLGPQLTKLEKRPDHNTFPRPLGFVGFGDFCAMEPGQRAKLTFTCSACLEDDVIRWVKQLSPGSADIADIDVVDDLKYWLEKVSMDDFDEAREDDEANFLAHLASDAFKIHPEASAVQGLLSLLEEFTYDPSIYSKYVKVVHRCLSVGTFESPMRLEQFVTEAVYCPSFKCSAMEIWTSVNEMFHSLPKGAEDDNFTKKHASVTDSQTQLLQLESHLGCVLLLQSHGVRIPITFWELRQCQDKPSYALSVMTTVFRGFTRDYHPAVWWRGIQEPVLKFSSVAFPCLKLDTVFDFIARGVAQHKHWDVLHSITEDWRKATAGGPAEHLYVLAKEMIDSCPSLKHPELDDASKVLGYIPEDSGTQTLEKVQAEKNLVKACDKLHQSLVGTWGAGATGCGLMLSIESVIGNPGQVRSMMQTPEEFVKTLLHFNPNLCEEIIDLLSILGFTPASHDWAVVMEMVAAAKLLCDVGQQHNRRKVEEILDQLLANKHTGAWKIAFGLAPGTHNGQVFSVDHGCAMMADSLKVAEVKDLPSLLHHFSGTAGCPERSCLLSNSVALPPAPPALPVKDRPSHTKEPPGVTDSDGPNFQDLFQEKEDFFPLLNTGARALSAATSFFSTFRGGSGDQADA